MTDAELARSDAADLEEIAQIRRSRLLPDLVGAFVVGCAGWGLCCVLWELGRWVWAAMTGGPK